MGNWVAAIQRVGGVRFPKGLRSTRGLIGSKLSNSLSLGSAGKDKAPLRFDSGKRAEDANFRKVATPRCRGRAVVSNEGSRRVTVAYSGVTPIPRKIIAVLFDRLSDEALDAY